MRKNIMVMAVILAAVALISACTKKNSNNTPELVYVYNADASNNVEVFNGPINILTLTPGQINNVYVNNGTTIYFEIWVPGNTAASCNGTPASITVNGPMTVTVTSKCG